MNTNLALVSAKALPALSGSTVTYNAEKNLFLTLGYTSAADNTYYDAIRLSNRLAVYCSIGEAWYDRTFLNGIKVFCWEGTNPRLIGQRTYGGPGNSVDYSEYVVQLITSEIVKDFLHGQAKKAGQMVSEQQLLRLTKQLVDELHQPMQLA